MTTRIGRANESEDAVDATLPARPGAHARQAAPKSDGDYVELVPVDPAHYAVDGEMARGGMGRILRARDRRLGRVVALKELASEAHPDLRARFEREARITARLQHPSIVPILEAGTWPTGEPFYAMKLVAGASLDKVIAKHETVAERLALVPHVIAAVDALAYAHHEHVIHRDLKPANVLVGTFGETIVIDWGLAKDLDSDAGDSVPVGPFREAIAAAGETVAGSIMGTPAYMPPEQARGDAVDPRADVYALGAMLYHVLAGHAPYEGMSAQLILAAVQAEPPSPIDPAGVPPELITIVDKAMAREASDRYRDAGELAADLKSFQTGQLVGAHRYTWGELARRWLKRYRAPVTVGAVAALALAVVGGVSISRVIDERDRADAASDEAVRARDEAIARQKAAIDSAGQAIVARAQAALDRDPAETLAWLRQLAVAGATPADLGAARVIAADALSRHPADDVWAGHQQLPIGVSVSPDGTRVASWDEDSVRVWSRGAAAPLVEDWHNVQRVRWCDDGRLSAGRTNELYTVDLASGAVTYDTGWATTRLLAKCSAAERTFRTRVDRGDATTDETVHYDPATNATVVVPGEADEWLGATRDGEHGMYLVHGELQSRTATGRIVVKLPLENPRDPWAASADGGVLVTWHGGSATVVATATVPAHPVTDFTANTPVVVSPDGRYLAQVEDTSLRVLDLTQPDPAHIGILPNAGYGAKLVFSPDGRWLAMSADSILRVYQSADPQNDVMSAGSALDVAFSADSRMLVAAARDRTIRRWTLPVPAREIRPDGGALQVAVALADGGIALGDQSMHLDGGARLGAGAVRVGAVSPAHDAMAWVDQQDRIWRYRVGRPVESMGVVEGGVSGMAMTGDSVLAWDRRETLTVLRTGAPPRRIAIPRAAPPAPAVRPHVADLDKLGAPLPAGQHQGTGGAYRVVLESAMVMIIGKVPSVAVTADGTRAAVSVAPEQGECWRVHLVDVVGASERELPGACAIDPAFSPDGTMLATATASGQVLVWDVATATPHELAPAVERPFALAFSPDGKTLAVGGDQVLVLFDPTGAVPGRRFGGLGATIDDLAFSPDGTRLATGGNARLWHVASGLARAIGEADGVDFTAKGDVLAWGNLGATVVRDDLPQDHDAFAAWLAALRYHVAGESGGVATN